TESRLHLSVYSPPKTVKEKIHHHFTERRKWKKIGRRFEKCYPVAPDVLHVICTYFGQEKKKCTLSSLAVDTETFRPIESEVESRERENLRKALGYGESDIVCLYAGRFTEDKGTVILARAVNYLQQMGQEHFKGLFVGVGDPNLESAIKDSLG